MAHLHAVHDAAVQLTDAFHVTWPTLQFDRDAVRMGAAIHDIGKVIHREELSGPGSRHTVVGPGLLMDHGFTAEQARFARTHESWRDVLDVTLEDLLVATADAVWKGTRDDALESRLVEMLSNRLGVESWEAYFHLDTLLTVIAADGERRVRWQAQFPVHLP